MDNDSVLRAFVALAVDQLGEWPGMGDGAATSYVVDIAPAFASVTVRTGWGWSIRRTASLIDSEIEDVVCMPSRPSSRSHLTVLVTADWEGRWFVSASGPLFGEAFADVDVAALHRLMRVRTWEREEMLSALRASASLVSRIARELELPPYGAGLSA